MSKIEDVLRHACTRAVDPTLNLSDALALYRSVATLARALRTERADNGLPRGFAIDLIMLLVSVLNSICVRVLDPAATPDTIASLAHAIGQISTASHLARPIAVKPPKPALAPRPQPTPAPAPKPVALQTAKPAHYLPAPVVPIDPKDLALANTLLADMTRRTIQQYKRAA